MRFVFSIMLACFIVLFVVGSFLIAQDLQPLYFRDFMDALEQSPKFDTSVLTTVVNISIDPDSWGFFAFLARFINFILDIAKLLLYISVLLLNVLSYIFYFLEYIF